MKKTKIASFITLLMPFVVFLACIISTKLIKFSLGILLLEILAVVASMALFGLISLIMNMVIIKKDGLGFVSFNLLVLSLAEFIFGAICVVQMFIG